MRTPIRTRRDRAEARFDRNKKLLAFQTLAQGRPSSDQAKTIKDARAWFRKEAMKVTRAPDRNELLTTQTQKSAISISSIGKMYMYWYDAKHKATLPYWDRFPVIFVLESYNDGFLGMNLHYLPPVLRAKLIDALYTIKTNPKDDDKSKLKITYSLLASAAKYKLFGPTIKRYLKTHVKSKLVEVAPEDWDHIAFLPLQKFVGARDSYVWSQSKKSFTQKRKKP